MAGNPLTDPNWAEQTTEQVVSLVDNVRSQTTRRVVLAARGLVYGLLAVFLGVFALVLALIAATRGVQILLDFLLDRPQAVYASYLVVGGILTIAGLVLFKKRNAS